LLLQGRTALVTGGSRGIGRAIVLELVREGVRVGFTHLGDGAEADATVRCAQELGGHAMAIEADVADAAAVRASVEAVLGAYGRIDILVNNAGITRDGMLWKLSEPDWDAVLDTNLKGAFLYLREVAPLLRAQGYGRVINITSINGLRGKFGQANYVAAKAGLIGLTKTAARELGREGITVNAVAPGLIQTEMMRQAPASVLEGAVNESLLKRVGDPEDIAWTVAFLASDRARHITGEVIKVDGGQYL
jgi:3-oxoacyl-[acyl-carrier protein] reductase